MSLKDILVHIDNRPTCTSRLEVAIKLAKQHGSLLAGIYVVPRPHYLADMRDLHRQEDEARVLFEGMTSAAGIETEWITVDSYQSGLNVSQAINLYSHYRDMLIISQTDSSAPDPTIPDNLPEKAVLGSGRPVLIVPYAGTFPQDFKIILQAWRGGPESARALNDAMPLLAMAEEVKVITVQGKDGDEIYQSHEADICHHMSRYELPGLSCEKRISGPLSVGDLLLNRCADVGADLLVMGATMQSRRGFQTLGDTGRHLLQHMTVPVLMSH